MRTGFRASLVFLLLLATIHPCQAGGSPQIPKQDFSAAIAEFSKYAENQIRRDQIPGMSIGFLKDDFVWTQGFGFADLENMVHMGGISHYRDPDKETHFKDHKNTREALNPRLKEVESILSELEKKK